MRRCRCSTSALELFVRDVAALSIRVPLQQTRQFSARPARRQTEVSRSREKDAYVPFETQTAITNGPLHRQDHGSVKRGEAALDLEEESGNYGEWHAELEIVPPTDEQSEHSTASALANDATPSQAEGVSPGGSNAVDFVALPNLGSPKKMGRLAASIPKLHNITLAPKPVPFMEETLNARQLRKSKRIGEGAFRPKRREAKFAKAMSGLGKADEAEAADQLEPVQSIVRLSPKPKSERKARSTKSEAKACSESERGIWSSEAKAIGERPQKGKVAEGEEVEDQLSSVLRNIEDMEGTGTLLAPKWTKPRKPRSETGRNAPKSKAIQEAKPGRPLPQVKRERWQIQKDALLDKHDQQAWNPRKRLSPDTLDGIRALHASNPAAYSTETLSEHFKVTPENIRRILKSKWRPNEEEVEDRRERWEKRGVKKWSAMAEQGVRPPKQWREKGVGSVKGAPEEKPAWKKGGTRSRDEGSVGGSWDQMMAKSHEKELGIAERFV